MRFVQFRLDGDSKKKIARVGLQKEDGHLVDLSGSLLPDCRSLVEALQEHGADKLKEIAASSSGNDQVGAYKLLAPITNPDKVICIGLNYHDHCQECGLPAPAEPLVFSKFPSAIVGPTDDIPYPDVTQELDWEVELTVVIGKGGKNIEASDAKDHVFGYTVAHDVTARDWQLKRNGGQWLLGKTMDGFCPMGPCIVTSDEIGDPHNLSLSCRVNGQVKQNGSTSKLVHNVYDCIAWVSKFVTLQPGDVILTGTPPGVGFTAKPPQLLQRGDVVECEVEKIGMIRNQIV